MGKHSIAPGKDPRKDNFTASELAEMARFDAALEAETLFLTKEERALSAALDREAQRERGETGNRIAAGPPAPRNDGRRKPDPSAQKARKAEYREAHREQLRLSSARYNEVHRQERRDYQRAYDAAHRAEINARRREKYAAKRAAEKRKEGNDGRKV